MAEKVADIRADLVKLGLTEQEANDIKGRQALLDKRDELTPVEFFPEPEVEEEYAVVYEEVPPDVTDEYEEDEYVVSYEEDNPVADAVAEVQREQIEIAERGTPEWEDYVMSHFLDSELIDFGKMKTPCLRGVSRVVNKLFDIEESGPIKTENWFANNHPAATVTYRVIAIDRMTLKRYSFSAVADAWIENMGTNKDFNVHPSSVAESKAESRALKKLLDLRSIPAYEEVAKTNDGYGPSIFDEQEETDDGMIKDSQKNTIEVKCRQFGIDSYKFINLPHFVDPEKHPEPKYSLIEEVSYKDAVAMLKMLADYQKSDETGKEIPDCILE